MYVLIDNYDSFSYTLASYLTELGAQLAIVRNDEVSLEELERLWRSGELEGIVISPGPGRPEESGRCIQALLWAARRVPVLGVCLGHQVLATALGAEVVRGVRPMHGQVSSITTTGKGLFAGLPRTFQVTRYHSLVVDEKSLPPELIVDARSSDGAIMALRHRALPFFGLQFHPEALCTQHGHDLLRAFLSIASTELREACA